MLLVISSCSQNPKVNNGEYLIKGKLENIPDSTVFIIMNIIGDKKTVVAQDTVINGEFMFSDTITDGLRLLNLRTNYKTEGFASAMLNIWVTPGSYTEITGSDRLFKTWDIKSDVQEQIEENTYVKATFPQQKRFLELSAEEVRATQRYYKVNNSDKEEQAKIKSQIDSLKSLSTPLADSLYYMELDYLKNAKVSYHWMVKYAGFVTSLKYELDSLKVLKIKELYGKVSYEYKQTALGEKITAYINLPEKVNVGDDMYDAELYDMEGNIHKLSEFKGKYILLDFWATWCGPCVASFPEQREIASKYEDQLTIVSISIDDKKAWTDFATKQELHGNQLNELSDVNVTSYVYGATALPTFVLISPDGKIRDVWVGYTKGSLKEKIITLLK
ncbi:MAG: TlpA disulfide reductase family protein [Rikenellaceae bacterium]